MPRKSACLFAKVAKQRWLQTVPKTFEKLIFFPCNTYNTGFYPVCIIFMHID